MVVKIDRPATIIFMNKELFVKGFWREKIFGKNSLSEKFKKRSKLETENEITDPCRKNRRELMNVAGSFALGGVMIPVGSTPANAIGCEGNLSLEIVRSVRDLPTAKLSANVRSCLCLGFMDPSDGGGGLFKWVDTSTAIPDGAMVVSGRWTANGRGRWLRMAPLAEVDVRWFGARGDGVSDNTGAFSQALAYLMSFDINIAQPWATTRPALYIPGGKYLTRPLPTLNNTQNIKIRGDGSSATKILLVTNPIEPQRPLFELAPFDVNPRDDWQGQAQGFELSDIYLGMAAARDSDDHKGIGIRDNGAGGLHLQRVHFFGFDYAVAAPYGSDFSRFIDCRIRNCNVGIYLGPGTQQIHMARLDMGRNNVGIVLDAVPQGNMQSCYFMDQNEADIVFEYSGSRRTRFGVAATQKIYTGVFSISDCWFETGTREDGKGQLQSHVHSTASPSDPVDKGPGGIIIQRVFVVSGTRNMNKTGKAYFWCCESGVDNRIEDIRVWGSYIDDIVNEASVGKVAVMRALRQS